MATNNPVTMETLIAVKVLYDDSTHKFKICLKDLGPKVLPQRLRQLLQVPSDEDVVFERYSDSAGAYVTLDPNNPQVYKTLFRAAKAKLKLRLRATIPGQATELAPPPPTAPVQAPLFNEPTSLHRLSLETLSPPRVERPAPISPVIARSPLPCPTTAGASQPEMAPTQPTPVSPLVANTAEAEMKGEAPVPQAFTARQSFSSDIAVASGNADLAFRPKCRQVETSWVVYCNHCNLPMENEHYHCSICDQGDYDLCPSCVNSGVHCPGSGHWMVKRFVKNGCVVNSTTERVGPKAKPQSEQEMPGAFTEEKQSAAEATEKHEDEEPTRTCNCCVQVLHEREFVTCTSCEDYDLCMQCHLDNKHGHHPGHIFKAATEHTVMPALADFLCNAGRNVRHSAVCDGCEKFIYGVRHKCLNCPDWDFCSECIKSAKFIHPAHRFVPIYEPLAEPLNSSNRHYGIYCDGPLCKDKENLSYIEGVRYKCAVCHDTDFCANCEAHPSNRHNHTHPLIKFKRPVRSVSVTTLNEDRNGKSITRVGDREPARRSASTETCPVAPSTNTATQVQAEEHQPKTTKDKIEIRDLLAEPVPEKVNVSVAPTTTPAAKQLVADKSETLSPALNAHFVRDALHDGSKVCAGFQFVQVWTLRNPGPNTWPAGCSVRHVGGDNMLDLDNTQPLSQSELAEASESNVIGRPVAPGEEVAFRIVLKAPVREGTAISYWRLKTANGTPFGHRLWCDIQVISPPVPTSQPVPIVSEITASSSSAASKSSLYEQFQRETKLARTMSQLKSEVEGIDVEKSNADTERTNHPQEDVFERLRKMKLHMEDRARMIAKNEQEKMIRIQQVRKVAVDRLMEARRKEYEAGTYQKESRGVQKTPDVPIKTETAELPAEVEVAEKPTATEPEPQSSGMIFPQLDKESPVSSTHEAVSAPSAPQSAPSVTTASVPSDDEFFEDAESVEIRSLSSGDDGFMTDEEYDILDASDEEMP